MRMVKINWEAYKDFKAHSNSKDDNFITLINFLKSYYRVNSPRDMFESLASDELAVMMLQKRGITTAAELESFLFKL